MKHSDRSAWLVLAWVCVAALFAAPPAWAETEAETEAGAAERAPAPGAAPGAVPGAVVYPTRTVVEVEGWTLSIDDRLLANERDKALTDHAVVLLRAQLREVVERVPTEAVAKLKAVRLYFTPPYPGTGSRAEYHPDEDWLVDNGRDPAMVKSVEFTNVSVFELETRRMPNFALHELAHAYHDRFAPDGFENRAVLEAFRAAKASGGYDHVDIRAADGRIRRGKAYAMTNHKEYFAETTEAYFSINDIFPFNREELLKHDPAAFKMLNELWGE